MTTPDDKSKKRKLHIPRIQIDRLDRRKVKYIRMVGDIPTVISTKKVNNHQTQISLKKRKRSFDINKPAYREKNIYYYFVDVVKGQITFVKPPKAPDPELNDLTFGRQIIKQLVAGMENAPILTGIIMMLLGIGLGLACGFILGNYFPMNAEG